MLLSEKYAPTSLNGIVGNDEAIKRIVSFGAEAQAGKIGNPIMIYGNPGIGKTAAAHALAYSNGFDLIELSASDYRSSEMLEKKLLPANSTRNLFNRKIMILFDEIDEISAKFDKGVEQSLLKLIKTRRHPVVLTANDFWNRNILFLRNEVEKVEFKNPRKTDVVKLLVNVLEKEGKSVDLLIVNEIAQRSSGDIRGALNDLEFMMDSPKELMEFMGARDRKVEVFKVLDKIFFSKSFDIARNAMFSSDVDLGTMINWLEQNIPVRYMSKKGKIDAYENLARASMFNDKASRVNYYGYLRYASVIMSAGVAVSNDGSVSMLRNYTFPSNIKYMSVSKGDRNALSKIAAKLSPILHTSKKGILNSYLPMLKIMIDKAKTDYGKERVDEFMMSSFRLEPEEVDKISEYYQFR
ncbi:MAG: replication factor C large subunit [Candidatus Micrarchaeota archaeon]|nr:replication factor C large subunit [Candidatus Micrarchaeota archaeon]MDE1823769.1 replication factor C large subunit [Candidatus Micrarchaeota archaeon]MDE1849566.1 replication factor C large subunit [Candidatus Micrarchaeota archaeon]